MMHGPGTTGSVPELMQEYARLTGLDPRGPSPRRYLWTDSFAVCNYLGLYQNTGTAVYRDLALRLVDQVHHTLGKHRPDGPGRGWISGLPETEGEEHPTIGGLRIGKKHDERQPGEPSDEQAEWDRDGQYFHYLTKWMHALNQASRYCGDPVHLRHAVELAKTAYARFMDTPASGPARIVWKMSIDLSHPLVTSMGIHDPLDGLVTYTELAGAIGLQDDPSAYPSLQAEIAGLAELCRGRDLFTDDPLGIGELLFDASRIAQMTVRGNFPYPELLPGVMDAALLGLRSPGVRRFTQLPPEFRLAFRELGLSIGLHGVEGFRGLIGKTAERWRYPLMYKAAELGSWLPLADTIEEFWQEKANRNAPSWTDHREINLVMLATSLSPEGFLTI